MISNIWIANLPVPQGDNIALNIRTAQILAPCIQTHQQSSCPLNLPCQELLRTQGKRFEPAKLSKDLQSSFLLHITLMRLREDIGKWW